MNFESDLHLTYLVTPADSNMLGRWLNWTQVYNVLEKRQSHFKDVEAVMRLEGINLSDVFREKTQGQKMWEKPTPRNLAPPAQGQELAQVRILC